MQEANSPSIIFWKAIARIIIHVCGRSLSMYVTRQRILMKAYVIYLLSIAIITMHNPSEYSLPMAWSLLTNLYSCVAVSFVCLDSSNVRPTAGDSWPELVVAKRSGIPLHLFCYRLPIPKFGNILSLTTITSIWKNLEDREKAKKTNSVLNSFSSI